MAVETGRRLLKGLTAALVGLASASAAQASAGLVVSPAAGRAPLSVTFTGHSGGATFFGGIEIDFGDGSVGAFCRPGAACRDVSVAHSYAKPGEFHVRLLGHGEGSEIVLATVTVTAS